MIEIVHHVVQLQFISRVAFVIDHANISAFDRPSRPKRGSASMLAQGSIKLSPVWCATVYRPGSRLPENRRRSTFHFLTDHLDRRGDR